MGGVHGSDVAVGALSTSAHGAGTGPSGASAVAGSTINAVAGVEVKSCGDIQKVTGTYSDDKTAYAAVATNGQGLALAGAAGLAGGGYLGQVNSVVAQPSFPSNDDKPKKNNKH
jgi:hypothetical protein